MRIEKSHDPIQRKLRRCFEAAASKSLAVLNLDDAEPEMDRFLRLVQRHPEQRPFVASLFVASFDGGYYLAPPADFLRFCMRTLRWPEVRDFLAARREAEASQRGARTSPIWADLLEVFQDQAIPARAR